MSDNRDQNFNEFKSNEQKRINNKKQKRTTKKLLNKYISEEDPENECFEENFEKLKRDQI